MDHTKIPILGGLLSWLEEQDINYGTPILLIGAIIVLSVIEVTNTDYSSIVTFLFLTAPVWLPYLTFHVFFYYYMDMVGNMNALKGGRTVMEIVLPAEVFKSPEAMEFVLSHIWNKATPDNLMETYLDGKRPPMFTFELVSRGGDVRFYATSPNKNVQQFKDAMYAQYPGVEIKELPIDYTAEIPLDLEDWICLAIHMSKKKDQAIPIKTYIDFGMDKLPKEEEKVDPMTPMLEMLASIRPNQQMWIQFLFKAHREDSFLHGQLSAGPTWDKGVQKQIDKVMGRDKKPTEPTDFDAMPRLTPGERSLIEAMERNMGKMPFEFACRVMYLSKKDSGGPLTEISNMLRTFAATEVVGRNGIGARWRTDFNYKFISDPFNKILPQLRKDEIKEYKLRKLDPKSGAMSFKVLSSEELATIFHLPGKVAITPTLNRVQSTRGEAPANLPTGQL